MPDIAPQCHFSEVIHLFETASLTALELMKQARLASHGALVSLLLQHPQHWDYTHVLPCPDFYMCSGVQIAYMASTSPTEPSYHVRWRLCLGLHPSCGLSLTKRKGTIFSEPPLHCRGDSSHGVQLADSGRAPQES